MVTSPPSSTMTGTARRPPECWSISVRNAGSFRTLMYSTVKPFCVNAARAFDV